MMSPPASSASLLVAAVLLLTLVRLPTASAVTFASVAPASASASGVLDASNLGITSIAASDFNSYAAGSILTLLLNGNLLASLPVNLLASPSLTALQTVDFSGNQFSAPASIPTGTFAGASITNQLLIKQAGLRASSIQPGAFDNSLVYQLFLSNDDLTAWSAAQQNHFSPAFPSGVLRADNGGLKTLAAVWIGYVESLPLGLLADWNFTVNTAFSVAYPASLKMTLDFASGSNVSSAITRALTRVISPSSSNHALSLFVRGCNFAPDSSPSTSASLMQPYALYLPLEPSLLQPLFLANFWGLSSLYYSGPAIFATNVLTWNPLMPTIMPAGLLDSMQQLQIFQITVLGGTYTTSVLNPNHLSSPISTLPDRFFANSPSVLSGSLTVVDVSTAMFTTFPPRLFDGFGPTFQVFVLAYDALYSNSFAPPVGFFDSLISVVGSVANVIQSTSVSAYLNQLAPASSSRPYYYTLTNGVPSFCPAGSYPVVAFGIPYCSFCKIGFSCWPRFGQESLSQPCPASTYNSFPAQSQCASCDDGSWSSLTGQTSVASCIPCKVGKASATTGVSESTCQSCLPGSFASNSGSVTCSLCDSGKYQDQSGAQACVSCPVNFWQPFRGATNATSCLACPLETPNSPSGTTSVGGCLASAIPACLDAPGYYRPSAGGACNLACPVGHFCLGSSSPVACASGSYSSQPAVTVCQLCAAGKYSNTTGSVDSSVCTDCPLSTYSPLAGATWCSACAQDTIGFTTGNTSPSTCIANSGLCTAATGSFCPSGTSQVLDIAALMLPGGPVSQVANFSWSPSSTPLSTLKSLRSASSAALDQVGAFQTIGSNSFPDGNAAASPVSGRVELALILFFLLMALVTLIGFRMLPRLALKLDQFSMQRRVEQGESPVKQPSLLGSAFTMSFVYVALLVALLLATTNNSTTTSSLGLSSSKPVTGSAASNIELTVRAFADSQTNAQFCLSTNLVSMAQGFTRSPSIMQVLSPDGLSCTIEISCWDCVVQGQAQMSLLLPSFKWQTLEWELYVSGSRPASFSRLYGVVSQQAGRMLDARSQVSLTLIESFYTEFGVAPSRATTSAPLAQSTRANTSSFTPSPTTLLSSLAGVGYETSFNSYTSLAPQSADSLGASTAVQVDFVLALSNIVSLTSKVSRETALQLASSIVSIVVSLFGVWALFFKCTELVLIRAHLMPPHHAVHPYAPGHSANLSSTSIETVPPSSVLPNRLVECRPPSPPQEKLQLPGSPSKNTSTKSLQ